MRTNLMLAVAVAAGMFAARVDGVSVSGVSATQGADRTVTISYTLSEAPAVVTLDIATNGVSIGGALVCTAEGDVWRVVEGDAVHTISWLPAGDCPSVEELSFNVTAWPTNDPPDYMVVDISATAATTPKRYYPDVDFLPGGLFSNKLYRTSSVLMRKIPAKGVTWTMGAENSTNYVTLADNYYMGVFEVTQAQWRMIAGTNCPAYFTNSGYAALRPQESVRINNIRFNGVDGSGGGAAYGFVSNAAPTSYIGYLRSRTGVMFNLPSDAQWEYACRARVGEGHWNNGAVDTGGAAYTNMPGRCQTTGGNASTPDADCPPDMGGSPVVGSYAPNAWGLYDMHGGVWEICLDWYEADADIAKYAGAVNINPTNHLQTLSGETATQGRVGRGGGWGSQHGMCHSRTRYYFTGGTANPAIGFRLWCPAEAK